MNVIRIAGQETATAGKPLSIFQICCVCVNKSYFFFRLWITAYEQTSSNRTTSPRNADGVGGGGGGVAKS